MLLGVTRLFGGCSEGATSVIHAKSVEGAGFLAWTCRILLVAIFLEGVHIRYLYLLIWGGAEPDYLVWANANYFGGLSSIYMTTARNLLAGNWASIGSIYPPGYPFFLALVDGISGNILNARLVQGVIDSAAVFPLFQLLIRLGVSRPLGLLASLFYAVAPWWAVTSTFLLAEALFPAMVIGVLWGMIRCRDGRGLMPRFILGILSGVLPLFRPDMVLLVAPLAVWALISWRRRRGSAAALLVVGFLTFPLAWATFNWIGQDEFLLTSRSQWYAFWSGLGQISNDFGYYASDARAGLELHDKGIVHHTPEAEAYWRARYLEAWRRHPEHVLATIFFRID